MMNSEGPGTIIEMKHAAAAQLFVIAHAQKILEKQTIQNSGYTQT